MENVPPLHAKAASTSSTAELVTPEVSDHTPLPAPAARMQEPSHHKRASILSLSALMAKPKPNQDGTEADAPNLVHTHSRASSFAKLKDVFAVGRKSRRRAEAENHCDVRSKSPFGRFVFPKGKGVDSSHRLPGDPSKGTDLASGLEEKRRLNRSLSQRDGTRRPSSFRSKVHSAKGSLHRLASHSYSTPDLLALGRKSPPPDHVLVANAEHLLARSNPPPWRHSEVALSDFPNSSSGQPESGSLNRSYSTEYNDRTAISLGDSNQDLGMPYPRSMNRNIARPFSQPDDSILSQRLSRLTELEEDDIVGPVAPSIPAPSSPLLVETSVPQNLPNPSVGFALPLDLGQNFNVDAFLPFSRQESLAQGVQLGKIGGTTQTSYFQPAVFRRLSTDDTVCTQGAELEITFPMPPTSPPLAGNIMKEFDQLSLSAVNGGYPTSPEFESETGEFNTRHLPVMPGLTSLGLRCCILRGLSTRMSGKQLGFCPKLELAE
jgi:hypothetical protein